MKMKWFLGLCVLAGCVSGGPAQAEIAVDWPAYMAQQDLHWNAVPQQWYEAPFIGNGVMGSMIFQSSEKSLTIQIGRGDVQEHRMASGKHAAGNVLPDSSRLPERVLLKTC